MKTIFTILCFTILCSPFFEPRSIFFTLIYFYNKKNRTLDEHKKEELNIFITTSSIITILFFGFIVLFYKLFGLSILTVIICLIFIFVFHLSCQSILKVNLKNSNNLKKYNTSFVTFLCTISIGITIFLITDISKLSKFNIEINDTIKNFAYENNLIYLNSSDKINNNSLITIINNDLYFLSIIDDSNTSNYILYDKKQIDNSFEITLNSDKKKYKYMFEDYKNNFYYPLNPMKSGYLLNNNNVYELYAVIDKNKTNSFYISKYLLVDLKNYKIMEL